ncbi:hypothetical protein [Bradyrhizobium sp. Ec3.3]|uniref:hypothetical protein n=1 Tax=Bradyrhizobium sp. Ec3.3 TaxID=189753 RepID=UPI00047FF832|nr:hypothetical protein [Bradyrhizobium sp. Ec3.3]
MRRSIAISLLLICAAPAEAAPPASCAGKFIGVWTHQGIAGIMSTSTILGDGRALCSDNSACVQGTWTCSGNVLTYDNGMYKTDYTLQPNGTMTARGGIVVTKKGRPLGAAANVTADILGISREVPASPSPSSTVAPKPSREAMPDPADRAKAEAAARYARTLFSAGQAAARVAREPGGGPADWSTAEDRFREAATEFRKAGDVRNEKIALDDAAIARREAAKPPHSLAQAPKSRKGIAKDSLRCKLYEKQLEATADDPRTAELLAKLRSEHKDAGC